MWKTDNLFAESPFLHEYLCNAGEGYRQQHADDAEKGPEDGDREQDKERMQSGTAADNFRINIIGVDLLYDEESGNSQCAMQRTIGDSGNSEGGDHAEEWSEVGNDVEDAVQ